MMTKNFLLTLLSVMVLVSSGRAQSLRGTQPPRQLAGLDDVFQWWRNTYVETVETVTSFFGDDNEPEVPGFSDEPTGFTEPAPAVATTPPTEVVTMTTTFESSFAGTSDE